VLCHSVKENVRTGAVLFIPPPHRPKMVPLEYALGNSNTRITNWINEKIYFKVDSSRQLGKKGEIGIKATSAISAIRANEKKKSRRKDKTRKHENKKRKENFHIFQQEPLQPTKSTYSNKSHTNKNHSNHSQPAMTDALLEAWLHGPKAGLDTPRWTWQEVELVCRESSNENLFYALEWAHAHFVLCPREHLQRTGLYHRDYI
jgi:hypothetical protein